MLLIGCARDGISLIQIVTNALRVFRAVRCHQWLSRGCSPWRHRWLRHGIAKRRLWQLSGVFWMRNSHCNSF